MTSKRCRRCSSVFLPARPNQQYCSKECSDTAKSEREKIYKKNKRKGMNLIWINTVHGNDFKFFILFLERVSKESTHQTASKPPAAQNLGAGFTKLKNIDLSIQEACNQTERGKVTIIDISKDLPETLTNWNLFARVYYSHVGTVIKFIKINAHHWSILNETEREKWTVGKYSKVSIEPPRYIN